MRTKGSKNKSHKKVLNKWGYYEVYEPLHPLAKKNGYIREHRKIAYDVGILTDATLEVHHINGIKTDNRIENLQMLPKKEHSSITWKGKKRADWTDERRKAKSEQMKGNKNYKGKSPSLLEQKQ